MGASNTTLDSQCYPSGGSCKANLFYKNASCTLRDGACYSNTAPQCGAHSDCTRSGNKCVSSTKGSLNCRPREDDPSQCYCYVPIYSAQAWQSLPDACIAQDDASKAVFALGGSTSPAAFCTFIGVLRAFKDMRPATYTYPSYVSTANAGTVFWGTFAFSKNAEANLGASAWTSAWNEDGLAAQNADNAMYLGARVTTADDATVPAGPKKWPTIMGRKFLAPYGLNEATPIAYNAAHAADIEKRNPGLSGAYTPFVGSPFWVANARVNTTDVALTPLYAAPNGYAIVETFGFGAPAPSSVGAMTTMCGSVRYNTVAFGDNLNTPFGLRDILATGIDITDNVPTTNVLARDLKSVQTTELTPARDPTGILQLVARGRQNIIAIQTSDAGIDYVLQNTAGPLDNMWAKNDQFKASVARNGFKLARLQNVFFPFYNVTVLHLLIIVIDSVPPALKTGSLQAMPTESKLTLQQANFCAGIGEWVMRRPDVQYHLVDLFAFQRKFACAPGSTCMVMLDGTLDDCSACGATSACQGYPWKLGASDCGYCGNTCGASQVCQDGKCGCAAGKTKCGAACLDTQTDPMNCRECFNECKGGQTCVDSACTCPPGHKLCKETCLNVTGSDNSNCGDCDAKCDPPNTCVGGICTCVGGLCNGRCPDYSKENANCGSCGNECKDGRSCVSGDCVCPTGVFNDDYNCGTCGFRCIEGRTCQGGTCACPTGDFNDNENCGSCGFECKNGQTCVAGNCACTNGGVLGDIQNCGNCAHQCTNGQTCVSGNCACADGVLGDVKNCGNCGTACPEGDTCCSGGCVNFNSDPNNCGSCNVFCNGLCLEGSCAPPKMEIKNITTTTFDYNIESNIRGGKFQFNGHLKDGSVWVSLTYDLNNTASSTYTFDPNATDVQIVLYNTFLTVIAQSGYYLLSCADGVLGDNKNCGRCDNRCSEGTTCCNGSCVNLAAGGTHLCEKNGNCGLSCTSKDDVVLTCGNCNNTCQAGHVCWNSQCIPSSDIGDVKLTNFVTYFTPGTKEFVIDSINITGKINENEVGVQDLEWSMMLTINSNLYTIDGIVSGNETVKFNMPDTIRICGSFSAIVLAKSTSQEFENRNVLRMVLSTAECEGKCAEGEVCGSDGTCVCPDGVLGDVKNCGACGTACAEGTETCMDGACMCNEQNAENCGRCGNACPEGHSCCDGNCIDGGGCGCDCKGTEVCDPDANRCSDAFCTNDAQCQARGTGYCVTAADDQQQQYTCSQEFCNPYEDTAGKPCADQQVCAYPWPGSTFQAYRCSAEFCSKDADCIARGGPNKCAIENEMYTCESNYCKKADECVIGGCVNYMCTGSCLTTNAPLADQAGYTIPMQSNNTAYTYAPIEMFETKAFYSDQYKQYFMYIYGFWGFIQASGNQIFANQYVNKYPEGYSNPPVEIFVQRVAGQPPNSQTGKTGAGYRNDDSMAFALFNQPQGLAVCKTKDDQGKYRRPIIFVADTGNHCIRMISATITPNGSNGNPTSTTRSVSTLTGSNWDGQEHVDGQGYSIELPITSGDQDGTLYEALFDGPTGLDFDSNGILYVADTGNNKIRKINIDQANIDISDAMSPLPAITGKVSTLVVEGLKAPRAVLFHSGMLYVSDETKMYTIDVLNTNAVTTIATGLSKPYGLAFSGKNLLFSDDNGVNIIVGPNDIRPVPNAVFSNKPLALMQYKNNIVVGLKDATAVQISGKNCTCFPEIANSC